MADAVVSGARDNSASGGEAYWREQVAAWKSAGVSQTRFCKERGLSRFVFGSWKIRLEGRNSPGEARLVRLKPGTAAVTRGAGGIRLWVPGGYRVEVPERFDAQTLSRLLDVLEGR